MELKDALSQRRKAAGLTQAALSAKSGVSQSLISEMESGKRKTTNFLPELAQALGCSVADLDPRFDGGAATLPSANEDGPLHFRPLPTIVDTQNRIPLFASAEGGEGSLIISADEIDRVPRPYTLEHVKEAYTILIEGESMDPAFEPGDIAWVNPLLGARRNHDVILYGGREGGGEARALIKRVVSAAENEWTVKQYNPAKQFKLRRDDWPICHRVVGKLSKR